jgi:hypothetical protein
MGRKKKISLKLSPDWLLKEPIDFEYNKYKLLDYIKKCESGFDNLELYPDFVELSLHLANIQSLIKNKKLLTTNKKFESCDDEILIRDLIEVPFRDLSEEEQYELDKTITYSGTKLFDTFSVGKSIWNLVFDYIELLVRKNKKGINLGKGFVFYVRKDINQLFVWEYLTKKQKNGVEKVYITQIYEGFATEMTISDIIDNRSSFNTLSNYLEFPIFEVRCDKYFPMEKTFVPMVKRKLLSYIFQVISFEKVNKF